MTGYDLADVTHFRMLRTIYVKLTRSKSCPSIGRHWSVIGFQDGDPKTDLNRSGGVLNIIHVFYFLTHHFDMLKQVWLLSQDDQQHFPLFCMSIRITKMVTDALLDGSLSSICNKASRASQKRAAEGERRHSDGGLFETTCFMHTAGLHYFYWLWRHQKRTIQDTERTELEVKALMMQRPRHLLEQFYKCEAEDKRRQDPSKLEFTDLDLGSGSAPSRAKSSKAQPKRPAAISKRWRSHISEDEG